MRQLTFTENHGQWDEAVRFKGNAGGANMWFTEKGMYFQSIRSIEKKESHPDEPFQLPNGIIYQESDSFERLVIKASFVGANLNPAIFGSEPMAYRCNYFIGNDPSEWHLDVPNYRSIIVEEIYADIDIRYYSNNQGRLEYDFIVAPGADFAQIQVKYENVKSLSVNDDGDLVIETEWNTIRQLKPNVFQYDRGAKRSIDGRFNVLPDNTFTFQLESFHNPELALIIDPVLVYSTYLGGSGSDLAAGICVNSQGSVFVTGITPSLDFPTENPYDSSHSGQGDVFITKFASDGRSLIYSTFLGGSDSDEGYDICVDADNNVYVAGNTESSDFPTENAFDSSYNDIGGKDIFVAKLSPTGDSLIYSTFIGGSDYDELGLGGICIDAGNNAYVTGHTLSTDFPIKNQFQTYQGADPYGDAFVTKLSDTGDSLIYSTYLGGTTNDDWGRGVFVDQNNNAYVSGLTRSSDFPIENPFQASNHGGWDCFISKLSTAGDSLIYSTYLGGSNHEGNYDICVDDSGNAFIAGSTKSPDFPTKNAYDDSYNDTGGDDIFITKMADSGDSLVYSTYLGTLDEDRVAGICVNDSGNVFITGLTRSSDFPTENAYDDSYNGFLDCIITKMSTSGDSLIYSTYLGGSSDDLGYCIAVDNFSNVYVVGETNSIDFPTRYPYDIDLSGQGDAFITKLSAGGFGDNYSIAVLDSADLYCVRAADLDRDNYMDIVYSSEVDTGLYISYGDAIDTISDRTKYLNISSAAMAIGYVDRDTLLDIVAVDLDNIYILLNQGNRLFTANTVPIIKAGHPTNRQTVPSISLGYFDDDSDLDIVIGPGVIYYGDGFGDIESYQTLGYNIESVDVTDFDKDGRDDLLISGDDSVKVLINDGVGDFVQAGSAYLGQISLDYPPTSAITDFNHDRIPDFALVQPLANPPDSSRIIIGFVDALGDFSDTTITVAGKAYDLLATDVNRDTEMDFVVSNGTYQRLEFYFGHGTNEFDVPEYVQLYAGDDFTISLSTLDLNRDGNPDYISGGPSGDNLIAAIDLNEPSTESLDEMVVTGYNGISLEVINPDGFVISRNFQTVAGADYWVNDVNGDQVRDEESYDYNLQYGDYTIIIEPGTSGEVGYFDAGVRIDGSVKAIIFDEYNVFGVSKGDVWNNLDSVIFYYPIESQPSISPYSGQTVGDNTPTFNWSGMMDQGLIADSFYFQLSNYHDFRDTIEDSIGILDAFYTTKTELDTAQVYYWRIQPYQGDFGLDFTYAFAVYISSYVCGDANSDESVNVSDAVSIINYVFIGGVPPSPLVAGDVNCDGTCNVSDAVAIINYVFIGGYDPCDPNDDGIPDC
jgi:hypothetical protein